MNVKMHWIRKPAKRTFAVAVSACLLVQTLFTFFAVPSLSSMAEGYVGSGMTASLDENGNLVLNGKYNGDPSNVASGSVYELPIYQDENNTDFSTLKPLASFGASSKVTISEFDGASLDGWTAGSGARIQSMVASSQVFNAGQPVMLAASGGHYLQVTGTADAKTTVKKQFSSALNLAGYRYISFYFQADAAGTVEVTLAPTNGEMKTYSKAYTPVGGTIWTSVEFDISNLSGRAAIWEIAISYQGSFLVDSVCATAESRNLPATLDPSAALKIADFTGGSLDGFLGSSSTVGYVAADGWYGNNHCLQVIRDGHHAATPCYTVKTFDNLDLSAYNMLSFYANSHGIGGDQKFYIDLTLTASDGSVYQKTQEIVAGEWQILTYDISKFAKRDSIVSMQIGFYCTGFDNPWGGSFFIDDIYAHGNIATGYGFEYAMANGWQGADYFKTDGVNYPAVTGGAGGLFLRPGLSASQGQYAYVSVRDLSTTTLPSTIRKAFAEPLDLSRYSLIAFDANAWVGGSASGKHRFHLTLESGSNVKEYTLPVLHNEELWRTLVFDITDCEFRNNLTAIKIGWSFEDGPATGWDGLYYIDNIRFGGIGEPVVAESVVQDLTFGFENGDAQGWTVWENNTPGYAFSSGGSNGPWPYSGAIKASEGDYCFTDVRGAASVEIPSKVKCDFAAPMDLSNYTTVTFDASASPGGSLTDTYRFHLYLKSGDQVKEYSVSVLNTKLEWHSFTFDISDCEFLDSVTAIGLGCSLEGGAKDSSGTWQQPYYFDNIRFSKGGETSLTETKFNFEDVTSQGWERGENYYTGAFAGAIVTGGPGVGVWAPGNSYYLEASEGNYCIVGVRDGAPVATASTVKCEFADPEDWSAYKWITFDASAALGGSLTNTYRFHLYLKSGDQVKEYSTAVVHDNLVWHTISLDISDCAFLDNITSIELGLSLEGGTSDDSGTWWQPYYFDNIRFGRAGEEAPAADQDGIDEQGNIELVVPVDQVGSLESKFVIVVTDTDDESQLLSPAQYISDFSSVSNSNDPYPTTASIKGIGHVLPSDNERLGSNNSGININLSQFVNYGPNAEGTVTYTYKGTDYHFSKAVVQYYDDYIRVRSTNGEIMYAILILPITSTILVHPNADKLNDTLSMVDLSNQANVELYSAIISFISNRYNGSNPELGRICDYIVGNEIGNRSWNSMGDADLDEYVVAYERWLRLTNALVKQAWSNARVFASFDYWWAETVTYSQPELIKEIDRLSKAGGDYDWNVAWHPYPGELLDAKTTWSDAKSTDNINTTPRITWKNLQLLPQFLKDNDIEFNGETRRIILSEQGFHSGDNSTENQKIQAAAFAYAYYKVLSLPEIDYFCLRDGVDRLPETENGLQLGIWTMVEGQEEQPDKEKLIYDVVKRIDTVESLDATRFVFDVIPASYGTTWEELVGISEDEIRALCTLPVVETGTASQSVFGEQTTLSAGTKENWLANDNTSDLTVTQDASLGAVLSMNVIGDRYKDFKGATYTPAAPLNLTGKVIVAKVKANGLAANQQMEYMIRAYSGNQVIEGSYKALAGDWQTIALDVSGFTGEASVDRIKVWVRPANNTIWNGNLEITGLSTALAVDAEGRYNVTGYKATGTYPAEEGKLFAGWYADSDYKTPYTEETGYAYAKFVNEKVLAPQAQIIDGTTSTSLSTDMRFVATVDSLDYSEIGFDFKINGKKDHTFSSKVVYESMWAGGELLTAAQVSKIPESAFIYTRTFTGIPQSDFDTEIHVRAWWTTLDGTKVYSDWETRTVSYYFD